MYDMRIAFNEVNCMKIPLNLYFTRSCEQNCVGWDVGRFELLLIEKFTNKIMSMNNLSSGVAIENFLLASTVFLINNFD